MQTYAVAPEVCFFCMTCIYMKKLQNYARYVSIKFICKIFKNSPPEQGLYFADVVTSSRGKSRGCDIHRVVTWLLLAQGRIRTQVSWVSSHGSRSRSYHWATMTAWALSWQNCANEKGKLRLHDDQSDAGCIRGPPLVHLRLSRASW